jgi:hypothetical protein
VEITKHREESKKNLSPRSMQKRHNINTALIQSVAKIGTQSTMKITKKTLHKFSPHTPQKRRKGTPKSSSTNNEMLHADTAVGPRVINTHATEATNCHQNSKAIN